MTETIERLRTEIVYINQKGYEHFEKVCLASVLGSTNYGLEDKDSGDFDTMMYALPSLQDVLLGNKVKRRQVLDGQHDVVVRDLREIVEVFDKLNFSSLQSLFTEYKEATFSTQEIIDWIEEHGMELVNLNLIRLVKSTIGEYQRHKGMSERSHQPLSDKAVARTVHAIKLIEFFIKEFKEDKILTMKDVSQFSIALGTKPFEFSSGTYTLWGLKFHSEGRSDFEALLSEEALDALIQKVSLEFPFEQDRYTTKRKELEDILAKVVLQELQSEIPKLWIFGRSGAAAVRVST